MSDEPTTAAKPGEASSEAASPFHARLWRVVGSESQNSFAKRAGLAPSTLNRVWHGAEPTLSTLLAIAKAASVSAGWLAAGEPGADRLTSDDLISDFRRGTPRSAGPEKDRSPAQSGSSSTIATPAKPVLDHDTLKVVIEEIEEHLRVQRKALPSGKKAELISLAYSLVSEAPDHQQKGATILRLVKLAG